MRTHPDTKLLKQYCYKFAAVKHTSSLLTYVLHVDYTPVITNDSRFAQKALSHTIAKSRFCASHKIYDAGRLD